MRRKVLVERAPEAPEPRVLTQAQLCSHLWPLWNYLQEHGNALSASGQVDSANPQCVWAEKPIDFDLLRRAFGMPSFIALDVERQTVLCGRCLSQITTHK